MEQSAPVSIRKLVRELILPTEQYTCTVLVLFNLCGSLEEKVNVFIDFFLLFGRGDRTPRPLICFLE